MQACINKELWKHRGSDSAWGGQRRPFRWYGAWASRPGVEEKGVSGEGSSTCKGPEVWDAWHAWEMASAVIHNLLPTGYHRGSKGQHRWWSKTGARAWNWGVHTAPETKVWCTWISAFHFPCSGVKNELWKNQTGAQEAAANLQRQKDQWLPVASGLGEGENASD